jgi:hypothetical protein
MNANIRKLFLVRIGVMLWAIWLSQNNVVFDKIYVLTCMQIIYRGTHWNREWSAFQKKKERQFL